MNTGTSRVAPRHARCRPAWLMSRSPQSGQYVSIFSVRFRIWIKSHGRLCGGRRCVRGWPTSSGARPSQLSELGILAEPRRRRDLHRSPGTGVPGAGRSRSPPHRPGPQITPSGKIPRPCSSSISGDRRGDGTPFRSVETTSSGAGRCPAIVRSRAARRDRPGARGPPSCLSL
jgi:hypothetical protein